MVEVLPMRTDAAPAGSDLLLTAEETPIRGLTQPKRGFMLARVAGHPRRLGLIGALAACAVLLLVVPAAAQQQPEYQTPTTPTYQPPGAGNTAPDEGAGETPGEEAAPGDNAGEAPDTGAGAPGDTVRTQAAGTLPHTGFEQGVFLAILGLVLLLAGATVRRALRPPQLG